MQILNSRVRAAALGALLTLGASTAALADDTEIFFNQTDSNVKANVLLILDTSGSMQSTLTSWEDYDPGTSYVADSCSQQFDTGYVYFSATGASKPGCGSQSRIPIAQFSCADASTPLATTGSYNGSELIRWVKDTVGGGGTRWRWSHSWTRSGAPKTGYYVDCKADQGTVGEGDPGDPNKVYPATGYDNSNTTGKWSSSSGDNWWAGNSGGTYTIYTANYLNYYYDSTQKTTDTKANIMKKAAKALIDSTSDVNIGLMRYDQNAHGGMVRSAVADVATNRAAMKAEIDTWAFNSNTPISETFYEAYLYYAGGELDFGDSSSPTRSVDASRTEPGGSTYKSPAEYSCQKNYIVFLTDGAPTSDSEADTAIQSLASSVGAACYAGWNTMWNHMVSVAGGSLPPQTGAPGAGIDRTDGGYCTAALAKYMYQSDLRSGVTGKQNVTSYFIGFGEDFTGDGSGPAKYQFLKDAATSGGGRAYSATDARALTTAFESILADIPKTNTLFSAPAVAVNAFNRTQTLDDLYVSIFRPTTTSRWPGNVKKYKVVDGEVRDSNGVAAVDSNTGFFKDTSLSYWTDATTGCVDKDGVSHPDGVDVTCGGAALRLPGPTARKVYTHIGANPSSPAALTGSEFNIANTAITTSLLSLGGSGDPVRDDLINWARGLDVLDQNQDASTADARNSMGDPIHTAPAIVIYGANGDGSDNGVAYVTTNDGYLHAIDVNTGEELWAFIPQEMLGRLKDLYKNTPLTGNQKKYGLDGAIRVLKYDINGDGTIDTNANDRVVLYFGTGHNAETSRYYAIDVSDKESPKYMWGIGADVLAGLGQAWSEPVVARVNIDGASQNSQKLVLVIGGGYDPVEDGYDYVAADSVGNHVFMVDALKGTLLWSAGSGTANFVSTRMTHSIPSQVAALDTNSDGYVDRMYVGDMAGQLWRFDVWNGKPVSQLVTGGVIASLGAKEDSTHPLVDTRRFYAAPDVAVVQKSGMTPFLNIAIGSGYRGHPLNADVQDRFYAIRDYNPFVALDQVAFNALYSDTNPVTDAGLVDITTSMQPTIPDGSPGWKLRLDQSGGWVGEKVLVPARTFNNQVIFTTYTPNTSRTSDDPCLNVGMGTNRVYVVSILDGSPSIDRNKNGDREASDRSDDLGQSGIAPETVFLFPDTETGSDGNDGSGGGDDDDGQRSPPGVVCLSGVEVLNVCTDFNQRRKTYWREGTAN